MEAGENVESLLQELTIDEKIKLLSAKNIWETPEIERLGIPSLKVSVVHLDIRFTKRLSNRV